MKIKVLSNKAINKCPAVKFVPKRTANAMGRIKFLVNSINTMKGISKFGVSTTVSNRIFPHSYQLGTLKMKISSPLRPLLKGISVARNILFWFIISNNKPM